MHHFVRAQDVKPQTEYAQHSAGLTRASLVDRSVGAVHTGFGFCRLEQGGSVDTHVHSFEELFYVVEGSPILVFDGQPIELLPGACGVIPVGVPHAWRGPKQGPATWIDMLTPIPRTDTKNPDTFFLGSPSQAAAAPLDIRDPRNRHLFRMTEDDITLSKLQVGSRVNAPTVSASMATALLAYSGIALKMLVDERLGAVLANMFMVEYQPGGVAHLHDHPLEEAYYIMHGEVEAVADDATYLMKPGDTLWTGVGCIHAFYNRSNATVRWLETQSPQLPPRYSYRFNRDWEYLTERLNNEA